MKSCSNRRLYKHNQSSIGGFSLIELMVSLGISLFLIAGIGYVYTGSKQTYRVQDQLSRLQENGRLAFEYLTRDIRMAGYWGCGTAGMNTDQQFIPSGNQCATPKAQLTNTLNNASINAFNFGRYIEGFDNVTSAFVTYPNVKVGTDVVIVRGADPLGIRVTKHPGTHNSDDKTPQSAVIQVDDASVVNEDDILFVTDCSLAAVFQATQVNDNQTIVHNTGGKSVPGNSTKLLCKDYTGGEVLKAFSHGYYIGTLDGSNKTTSTGRPALFRADFNTDYVELIPGVENMQITYGVDNNNDYFVDSYMTATDVNNANQWGQVKSVRIELLLVSTEDNIASGNIKYKFPTSATSTTTASDRRLYYVTTTTISIRNRTQ